VSSLAKLRVVDSNGQETPAQFADLAKWPDGSFKSVLVTLTAKPGMKYTLQYGASVSRQTYATRLQVLDRDGVVMVTTGPSRFMINKAKFAFLDQAWNDVNADGAFTENEKIMGAPGEIFLVDAKDNTEYKASLFASPDIQLEETGPVRTVIRVAGKLQANDGRTLTDFIVRLYAYADQDFITADYTLVDTREEADVTKWSSSKLALAVKAYGIRLPLVPAETVDFGGEVAASDVAGKAPLPSGVFSAAANTNPYLYQKGSFNYVDGILKPFTFGFEGVAAGNRAAGWMEAKNARNSLMIGLKDFWQQFPKQLSVENQTGVLYLHPFLASGDHPDTAYPPHDTATKTYKRPNTFYFPREGGAKTYQMLIGLRGTGTPVSSALLNQTFQNGPRLVAPAQWYASSGVFGDMIEAGTWSAGYDAFLKNDIHKVAIENKLASGYLAMQYGWRDYGDRLRGGWAAISADGTKVPSFYNDTHVGANNFFLQYLRTMDNRWYELGRIATLHSRDLDFSHANRKGYWRLGGQLVGFGPGELHAINHQVIDHHCRNLHPGHAHVSGMPNHYLLTGDKRSLEVMKEVGDWFVNSLPVLFYGAQKGAEAERDFAWPIYVMNEVYRATGDTKYLEAAAKAVQHQITWWETPKPHYVNGAVVGEFDSTKGTGYWHMYPRAINTPSPKPGQILYNGASPWMAGAMINSVMEFYEYNKDYNLIDNSVVREMLLQTMNHVVKYGWNESKVYKTYSYFNYSPSALNTDGGINHLLAPLAYLGKMVLKEDLPHEEWYDTAHKWLGIAKRKYEDWKIVKARSQQSHGFYGYECIHATSFWKIMKQLEDEGTLAGIASNT
jgi:hypothetical protein